MSENLEGSVPQESLKAMTRGVRGGRKEDPKRWPDMGAAAHSVIRGGFWGFLLAILLIALWLTFGGTKITEEKTQILPGISKLGIRENHGGFSRNKSVD